MKQMSSSAPLFPDLPKDDEALSPLMTQYLTLKAQHRDCLLFFRLGDFYELFFEDAVAASTALDIALTRRGQIEGRDVPMCGVPAHAAETYLARLIKKGFRVAITEQIEDPATARKRGSKSIVARAVVRVVTKGTITEETLLDGKTSNHLVALAEHEGEIGIAWIDLSAGRPYCLSTNLSGLTGALASLDASEILVPQTLADRKERAEQLTLWRDSLVPLPESRFSTESAERRLKTVFAVEDLGGFGDFTRAEISALGALLDYVDLTQKNGALHLAPPRQIKASIAMLIDPATRRNLELTRTVTGERDGSLLASIDRTETGAGARLLAARLASPLTDPAEIDHRLDAIETLKGAQALRQKIRQALRQTPDLERALARLMLGRGGPRDLATISKGLEKASELAICLEERQDLGRELTNVREGLRPRSDLCGRLRRALADDLPFLTRDGNFIAPGYSTLLDEVKTLRDDSRRVIASMQQTYCAETGIASLKIRHNGVIGYYIETTPLNAERLHADKERFIHRQTMANAVRFTTVELGETERKITEASSRALAIEIQLFQELVEKVESELPGLRLTHEALAALDVASSLAELADLEAYTRPKIDRSLAFDIHACRHPVVEQALQKAGLGQSFKPNDCTLETSGRLWLLTGPNMAGKSTFLRQNAILAVLAQMGSFVPASWAHIGIVDKLFSRVGASDDLARGRSTFMVEMVETAAILNQATEKSLVILDEIGRGTATWDGLSLAWATIEHLHDANRCRALFATHYHELTRLSSQLPALRCHTMRIREWRNEIVFLHEIGPGAADRSYGIHVARMAGLPASVLARASAILERLEKNAGTTGPANDTCSAAPSSAPREESERDRLMEALDPDSLSPKEALDWIYKLKKL